MRGIRGALLLSAGYAILAALYIVFSSRIAANMSASIEDMQRIEVFKGVVFVAVTAAGVFAGAWYLFGRIERNADELRRRERALLETERRVFAGVLAASIAHDANNVLVGVLGDLYALRESLGKHEHLDRLQVSAERLAALNHRLLGVMRQGRPGPSQEVDLGREIRRSLDDLTSHRSVKGCRVNLQADASIPLRTNPLLVHQIVSKLVVNAGEATDGQGRIEVRLEQAAGVAQIEVHDDGPGVPAERRANLFDALETTKRDGSGLGLFSVRSCAAALGGGVEVGDSHLGGACFRVKLPSAPKE